ncbi:MAG: NUDIX domain-containing protein [Parcubacteria group bacterium]|nr:NUDIX domain-containing protein [Parcubacteria group bacterium]
MTGRPQTVSVLLFTRHGIPLLKDETKPAPHYWKLPGGKGGPGNETPQGIAIRKIKEKVGISLSAGDLTLVQSQDRGDHDFSFFVARPHRETKPKNRGEGGEIIELFDPQEILDIGDLFPNHRSLVQGQLSKR